MLNTDEEQSAKVEEQSEEELKVEDSNEGADEPSSKDTASTPAKEKKGKKEEGNLKSKRDMVEDRNELGRNLERYNGERSHPSQGNKTSDAVYSRREAGNHKAASV